MLSLDLREENFSQGTVWKVLSPTVARNHVYQPVGTLSANCSKNRAALFSLKVSGLHMTEQSSSRFFIERKRVEKKKSKLVEDDTSITQIVTSTFHVKLGGKKKKVKPVTAILYISICNVFCIWQKYESLEGIENITLVSHNTEIYNLNLSWKQYCDRHDRLSSMQCESICVEN